MFSPQLHSSCGGRGCASLLWRAPPLICSCWCRPQCSLGVRTSSHHCSSRPQRSHVRSLRCVRGGPPEECGAFLVCVCACHGIRIPNSRSRSPCRARLCGKATSGHDDDPRPTPHPRTVARRKRGTEVAPLRATWRTHSTGDMTSRPHSAVASYGRECRIRSSVSLECSIVQLTLIHLSFLRLCADTDPRSASP